MKKVNIIKKNKDFQRIIKNNRCLLSKEFVIYLERTEINNYFFGISVSKKLGNAVIRNKLKRQIKSIIDKKDYQKNFNCIIILRKGILNLTYLEKESALNNQFKKLNIYKEDENVKN